MRAALYLWRATAQRSSRTVLTVALIGRPPRHQQMAGAWRM
jgi:hypothetical protein